MADEDLLARLGTPDESAIAAGRERSGADRANSDILTILDGLTPEHPLRLLGPRLSSWLRRVRVGELAAPHRQRLRLESSRVLWGLVARVSIAPGIWWHQDDDGRLSVWATENQRKALGLPASRYPMLRTPGRRQPSVKMSMRTDDVQRLARKASSLLPPGLLEREAWRLSEGLRAATALLNRLRPAEVRTSSVEAPVLRGLVELAGEFGVATTYVPHAPLMIYPESIDIPHRRMRTRFAEDLPILRSFGFDVELLALNQVAGSRPTEQTPSTIISVSPWGDRQIGRFLDTVRLMFPTGSEEMAISRHPRLTLRQFAKFAPSGMRMLEEPLDEHLESGAVRHLITWSSTASRTALIHGAKVTSVEIWPWRHYRFEHSQVVNGLPFERGAFSSSTPCDDGL